MMLLYRIYYRISPAFRRKRVRRFVEELKPVPTTRILDVGGYPGDWKRYQIRAQFTLLNKHELEGASHDKSEYEYVVGDGRQMSYDDRAFDIVYSNSVIEHLSNFEDQMRFAREVRRVGIALWVQTPARCFPIEPHFLTPFIHYLPKNLRVKLARRFTVWGWIARPSPAKVEEMVNEIRLLDFREMQKLFPDCFIAKERFLGLTKSYIAIRKGGGKV